MSSPLLSPAVFFILLSGIFVACVIVAISLLRQEQRMGRKTQEDLEKYRSRIDELQAALVSSHEDYKQKLLQVEDAFKSKEQDFTKNISLVEEQLRDRQELRQELIRLQAQLSEKEVFFKKENAEKNETEKRLKEELSLAKQMYEGLKEQYTELEVSTERLLERIQQAAQPAASQKEGL